MHSFANLGDTAITRQKERRGRESGNIVLSGPGKRFDKKKEGGYELRKIRAAGEAV